MGYHSLLSVLTRNGGFTTDGGVRPCVNGGLIGWLVIGYGLFRGCTGIRS